MIGEDDRLNGRKTVVEALEVSGRDTNGRFAAGNGGGPGRPRQAIEVEYLAALGDSVSLDDWRQIASRAVQDAKNGDATARGWLSKHLLPENTGGLMDLAVDAHAGRTVDQTIAVEADSRDGDRKRDAKMNQLFGGL